MAERRRLKIICQRDMELDGLGTVEGQHLLLSEIARDYLDDLAARVTPAHHRNVEQKLNRLSEEFGSTRVRDLKPLDVTRFRNRLRESGLAHRTCNLYGDVLRAMLNWAVDVAVIAHNPLQRLKRLPDGQEHARYRRRALTEEEIQRFVAAAEADDRENGLRWRNGQVFQGGARTRHARAERIPQLPLWSALLQTGARWNELRTATWGDFDAQRRVLVLRAENTKSRKTRPIPITGELAEHLQALRLVHQRALQRIPRHSDRIFLSPDGVPWKKPTTNAMRVFDRTLVRARLPKVDVEGRKVDIHALRHTFASRLARANVSLVKAQRLLGHATPALTAMVYTHVDTDDLRDAVDALPPLRPAPNQNTAASG